jgi:hypothetical protein
MWSTLKISAGFLALLAFIVVLITAIPAYNRYQSRANANNKVKVTAIEIRNQAQQVKVAQQQADIRYQNAVGVRKAQDEIRKTLTPLYVQFEMVQALQQIATSGTNSTVIYLPTDPKTGLPVVPISNTVTPSK